METIAAPGDLLGSWVAMLMIVIARLSFIVFLLPGIGEQAVPVRVRIVVLIALAMLIVVSGNVTLPTVAPISAFGALLVSEIAIGFCLGVALRISLWILSIAGTIISQSIGLSQLLGVAMEREAQSLTANMLSMAGAALFLSADLHINAVAVMLKFYGDVPVGAFASLQWGMLLDNFYAGINFAVLLAWPFVAVNLLYNICLGFINKALPQLMVAFVGAPLLIGGGTLLLAISISALLVTWQDRLFAIVGWL